MHERTDFPTLPSITHTEQFGMENITVILDWSQEMDVSYSVIVDPEVPVTFIERARVQLLLSYNIQYNASVMATRCPHLTNTVFVELSYGEYLYAEA